MNYISPTMIASYTYCPRLSYLNFIYRGGGKKSPSLVIGSFEHVVFAEYAELTRIDWMKDTKIPKDEIYQRETRIEKVLEYAKNISIINYPEFLPEIHKNLDHLRFRLNVFSDRQFQNLLEYVNMGFSYEDAVNLIIPWKVEQWLASSKYGIRGRADAIYKLPKSELLIEDIKSHENRSDVLIHQDETHTQLVAYTIMAEELFGIPTNKARIFYSKDLAYLSFTITDEDKDQLIQIKDEAKDVVENGLPPKLVGEESIKCNFCYRRKLCFGLDKKRDDEIQDEIIKPKEEMWKKAWR